MNRWERVAFVVALSSLMYVEIRSIHWDQVDHDTKQAFATCEEAQKFQSIANGLSDSVEKSEGEYKSTIQHVNGVLKTTQSITSLSEENLKQITGGDSKPDINLGFVDNSHPYLFISDESGRYPLRSVSIEIEDVNRMITLYLGRGMKPLFNDIQTATQDYSLGDISVGQVSRIALTPVPYGIDIARYNVQYRSLNNSTSYSFVARKNKEGAIIVASTSFSNKVETQTIPPGFQNSDVGNLSLPAKQNKHAK